ncbi:MAG: shikimate kinase [Chloroflexaceae bacterium]
MNIMLIGFKSCGKSTVGAALAERLALTFVDTDGLLEAKHTVQTGETRSFREIYRQQGADYFSSLERQVVADLAQLDGYVIATGGRTLLDHPLPDELRAGATIVYLDAPPEILMARISAGGIPAFLADGDFETNFRTLYQERRPRYEQLADITLPVDRQPVEAIVAAIATLVTGRTK